MSLPTSAAINTGTDAEAPPPQFRQPTSGLGPVARYGSGLGRLYDAADALLFVALLNLLIVVMTIAGGIVLGAAPSIVAAATVSRARLQGDGGSMLRRFLSTWREQFVRANLLQAPVWFVLILFAINGAVFAGVPALEIAIPVAALLAAAFLAIVVVTDVHHELGRWDALRAALRIASRAPWVLLLLAATIALACAVTWLVPGLGPVITLGAVVHLCTAICLSFFAANARTLAASQSGVIDDADLRKETA